MMSLLGGFFGVAVLMLGAAAEPPHTTWLIVGAVFLIGGIYGTVFYLVRALLPLVIPLFKSRVRYHVA
jgi:predicted membrane-bound spermidine synthase